MTDNKVTFASTNSYSQALYELGNESGSLNEIEDQANSILKLISENAELKNFTKNPTNKIEDQLTAMNKISDQEKITFLFLFVTDQQRFSHLHFLNWNIVS